MEYFNIETIINPFTKDITQSDLIRAEKEYQDTNTIPILKLDKDLKLIDLPGNYQLGKKLGLKMMKGIRQRIYANSPTFPLRLNIEITTVCNSKCKICSRTKKRRPDVHLSFKDFKYIIDQTQNHYLIELYLYRLGEPFLNPELSKMLNYLNGFDNFEYIWISSNGLELSNEHIKMLLNSNVRIFNMSINGVDQKSYRSVNEVGLLENVERNFINAIELKKKKGKRLPFMRAQMISQGNKNDDEKFLNKWSDKADIINVGMIEFGSSIEFNYNKALNQRSLAENVSNKICSKPGRYSFYLYNDGSVVPCMCDYNADFLNIGNWRNQSIEDIFNSEKYKSFLNLHFSGNREKINFCSNCIDNYF